MARYTASSYDDYLCLRPPLLLWLSVLYYSRAIALPIVMAMGRFAGVNNNAIQLLRGLWSLQTLIPSLIAAAILYAMFQRVPTAPRPVRWVWAHGRLLLTLSAVIDLSLVGISLLRLDEQNSQMLPLLAAGALDAYFLLYILTARRVRDTFAHFPAVAR